MRPALLAASFVLLAPASVLAAANDPVRAPHGMVASSSGEASEAGVEILKSGGNAVDAAVAVALALAVTHPSAGNLGGGGFMLVRMADGRATTIDYREVAPKAASRTMYLDPQGNVIPDLSINGYRAVGVPGTVAGLELALKKYGTRSWAQVSAPAIRLAKKGFVLSKALADELREEAPRFAPFPESRHIWNRDGKFYEEGERFTQPELAKTLERLSKAGPRDFYTGQIASLIDADMKRGGGLVTQDDLAAYTPKEREPLHGTYRGFDVLTMPPPSSGGATLLQELNILELDDLTKLGANGSQADHLIIEAMRRAFADRALYFGDPDFVNVPVAALTSKAYAAKQHATIVADKATPSSAFDMNRKPPVESPHTTHFTVVDAKGNVVSNTFTLNMGFGSGATVEGAGFLLNDEMDDFTSKPGVPNGFGLIQGEANAIAPGKRPLSSMTPTVLLKDGRPYLVLGSPGGPTIINTVLQVILGVVDFHRDVEAAVAAPRLHQQWMPDIVFDEIDGMSPDTERALTSMGYVLKQSPWGTMGDCEAVMIEPGTEMRLGASDPRGSDARAVGY